MNCEAFISFTKDFKALKIRKHPKFSECTVSLPFSPLKRSAAIRERTRMLDFVSSKYNEAILGYQCLDGVCLHKQRSQTDGLVLPPQTELGEWVLVFGRQMDERIWLMEPRDFMAMKPDDILSLYNIGCAIVAFPDDIEWTVYFSEGLSID